MNSKEDKELNVVEQQLSAVSGKIQTDNISKDQDDKNACNSNNVASDQFYSSFSAEDKQKVDKSKIDAVGDKQFVVEDLLTNVYA